MVIYKPHKGFKTGLLITYCPEFVDQDNNKLHRRWILDPYYDRKLDTTNFCIRRNEKGKRENLQKFIRRMIAQEQDIFINDVHQRIDALRHRLWTENPSEPKRDRDGRITSWGESTFKIYDGKPLPNYGERNHIQQNGHQSPARMARNYSQAPLNNPPPIGKISNFPQQDFQRM